MVATTGSPRHQHPRRRGGRDSADGQVLGGLLVLGGIGWFLQQVGLFHLSVATMLSCLLITLGVGLVLTARRAGGAGLVIVGLALIVVLASASAVDVGVLQRGVGERSFVPTDVTDLRQQYQLGVGSLTLDLTDVDPAALAGRHIAAQVGVGELVILLPSKEVVAVDIRGEARAGEVDLFRSTGNNNGGTNVVDSFADEDVAAGQRLDLDLDVGLGTVQVIRPAG